MSVESVEKGECTTHHHACACREAEHEAALAAAHARVAELRKALEWYADPQNTVRECRGPGACANVDHCKLAITALATDAGEGR